MPDHLSGPVTGTGTGHCPRCGQTCPLLPSGAVEPHPGIKYASTLPGGICAGGGLLPGEGGGNVTRTESRG